MGAPLNNRYSPGRPKGSPNKATVEFRQAINNLITYSTPKMVEWLEEVSKEDKYKALELVYKFAQFGYPLLARSEHTGLDNQPIKHKVTVTVVKP